MGGGQDDTYCYLSKLIEDLDGYLADDDLDLRIRHRYTREVASMLRAVAEEKGELRATVEVETGPRLIHEVVGFDWNAWRDRLENSHAATSDTSAAEAVSAAPHAPAATAASPAPAPTLSPAPARQPNTLDPASDPSTPEHRSFMRWLG